MKVRYDVIIVGSGIAGLAAAEALMDQNLDILIIDENVHTGGQLLRKTQRLRGCLPKFEPDLMKSKGFSLLQKMQVERRIDWGAQAQVLGVFPDKKLLVNLINGEDETQRANSIHEVQAEQLIFATGARERYLPFKGWTLPGVMSMGAAQILMKSHGVLPARNTLIAGSSPLMMALASELLNNKGKISALVDENTMRSKLAIIPLLKNHWPKLIQGACYTSQILLNRVHLHQSYRVIEACGRGGFEWAIMAKTGDDGLIIPGTEISYRAEALAVGYGFVPNIELPAQAGCDLKYQENLGGWVVKVNETLESSIESVYCVGEVAGVGGGQKSFIQGRLAAMSILKNLGKKHLGNSNKSLHDEIKTLRALDKQQQDYAIIFNNLCRVPESVYAAIPDETTICRCEEITMGDIKKSIAQGFDTVNSLKKATRCGMGRCQGRSCGAVISDIITALTHKCSGNIGCSLSRTPVKNVAIKAFLNS